MPSNESWPSAGRYATRVGSDVVVAAPAYVVTDDKGRGIYDTPVREHPISVEEAIRLLRHNVDRPGLNPASGGHLGYIPGGGIYVSALGDYLADVMNRYAGVYFGSPGAVHLENMLALSRAGAVILPACPGFYHRPASVEDLVDFVVARILSGLGMEAAARPRWGEEENR